MENTPPPQTDWWEWAKNLGPPLAGFLVAAASLLRRMRPRRQQVVAPVPEPGNGNGYARADSAYRQLGEAFERLTEENERMLKRLEESEGSEALARREIARLELALGRANLEIDRLKYELSKGASK